MGFLYRSFRFARTLVVSRRKEKQKHISLSKMVIKETYDLKSLDTKYIHNAKTSKSMYVANILLSSLAVAGMLFTCKMATRILKKKVDTFEVVKKKRNKKENNESQSNSNDSDMSSSNENPEQFLETSSNMTSLNMEKDVDMTTCTWILEKTNTCRDDICYAETVDNSKYKINIQRNEPEEKEYCTNKSIKELISLIEEALK